MISGPTTSISSTRAQDLGRFAGITGCVLSYPLVFILGFGRWWDDPPSVAWAVSVVTGIVGAALVVVLGASGVSTYLAPENPAVRSLRQLLACALILAFGIAIAGLVGFVVGMVDVFDHEGSGSLLAGLPAAGAVVAVFGWIAWLATRP